MGSASGSGGSTLPLGTRPFDRLPSIRAKLGAVIVFAVAVTILIMYVSVGFALRRFERDRQFSEELGKAQGIAALGFGDAGRPSPALLRAVKQLAEPVVVVNGSGNLLLARDMRIPSTVGRVLAGRLDTGTLGPNEYVGVPVIRSGTVVGAVYLSYHVESGPVFGTIRFVAKVWWQFILAGACAAIVALVLARYLARGLTQPLRDMANAASRMATGDYTQRVRPHSRDEVGQLSEAFNRMAGEMEGLERLRRELVANVSHELKTPISALRARLENLLDGVEEPDPAVFAVMLQQSERLSRLVDQLLDLSRLESGDVPLVPGPVDLRALAERVAVELREARHDRKLVVRNEIPEGFPSVVADQERIHQVLFNLLDNAIRFTPSGGTVRVRATRRNGMCEVEVSDTGPGIPPEHLELVFERFYRVDPSRSRGDGGTGIGLAIARSVVEAHGGRIWAEEAPGGGASIRFVLPARGMDGRDGGRDDSANSCPLQPTRTGGG